MGTADSFVDFLVWVNTLYLTSVGGAMIGYPLVQLGDRWGKIWGSKGFKSVPVLFGGFILSLVIIGYLFEVATPKVSEFVQQNLQWKVLIDCACTLIVYVWFSETFGFKLRRNIVGILILGILVNLGYLYAIGAWKP
jgi:hypothetical protein